MFEGKNVPPLYQLIALLISQYNFPKGKESRIIKETIRIAQAWHLPEKIGNVIPDPRIAAMDRIKESEVEELREGWEREQPKKYEPGRGSFRHLLIALRALLLIEKYPNLYHKRKVAMVRGSEY